jgi:hypothetical protein
MNSVILKTIRNAHISTVVDIRASRLGCHYPQDVEAKEQRCCEPQIGEKAIDL